MVKRRMKLFFHWTSFHPYGIHDLWQSDVDVQNIISNITKEWLCKWDGQNDVSLHRQNGHEITLLWLKND
jgi:hypothetical protein